MTERFKNEIENELGERVLFDRMAQEVPYAGDAFGDCLRLGWLHEHAPGIFSFRGRFLGFREAFDLRTRSLADQFACMPVDPPVLYGIEHARASGFFDATPQYAQFVAATETGGKSDCICRSAICQPIYPAQRDAVFLPDEKRTFTAVGKAFRGEPAGYQTLERLREFSMRELVFLGGEMWVRGALDSCRDWIENRMGELGLKGQITTATDPFFGKNSETLTHYQLVHEAKLEWRLWLPQSERLISVASINFHSTHFGKKFHIQFDTGKSVYSGCVGFGQERFLFAVLSQYGTDAAKWPAALQKFLT